ncbi:MAG: glycosyltransferase family 1 protein [bacterium]
MRIGIDCRTILNPGLGEYAGVGHYTYLLVKHLLEIDKENEYVLFFDYRMSDVGEFEQANVKVWRFPFSQYQKFLPFSYSHMLITAMILKTRLDVFHSPANVLPLSYPGRSVITIHDLAIYRNPEWFPGQLFSTRLLVPQSVRKARHIIAVSESTKRDLKDIFHVPSSKISVVYEAPFVVPINVKDRNVNTVKKFKIQCPYFLFLGTIDPRKNIRMLVAAFLKLRANPLFANHQLVIAGGKGYKADDILESVEQHRAEGVHYVGYLTHNEKLDLVRRSLCFVFPSLYEGFGLPVLEAMRMGVPVITSNTSSLPEVAGNAAVLVDPTSMQALRSAMARIATNGVLRTNLVRRGYEQAKKFQWEDVARKTLAIYQNVGRRNSAKKAKRTKPSKVQKQRKNNNRRRRK